MGPAPWATRPTNTSNRMKDITQVGGLGSMCGQPPDCGDKSRSARGETPNVIPGWQHLPFTATTHRTPAGHPSPLPQLGGKHLGSC